MKTQDRLKEFCTNVFNLNGRIVNDWLIKDTHRVGDYKNPKQPVFIAFVLWEDRQTLLRAAKDLYQYNKDNDTSFAVNTDLAPRTRQLRKDLHMVSNNRKAAEKCQARERDNPNGRVWLERKEEKDRYWVPVRHIDPKYLPKEMTSLEM